MVLYTRLAHSVIKNIILFSVLHLSIVSLSYGQNISLSLPSGAQTCNDNIPLDILIDNDSGEDIIDGLITLDLSGTAGLMYTMIISQSSGPMVSEVTAGVAEFEFVDTLFDGDEIEFQLSLNLGCEGATLSSTAIDLDFDYNFEIGSGSISESLNGFGVDSPDIDITSSTPSGIDGVIGYEFSIDNTVQNNGTIDADSVYYCIEDNVNAVLLSIEVGGMSISPSSSSLVGFTCFELGGFGVGANALVTENWIIVSCQDPIQNLFRKATFGCQGDLDCGMEDNSEFPTTVLTLNPPTEPISITTTNLSQLNVCGPSDTICINVSNNNPDGFTLKNVKTTLDLPPGVEVDFSTLTTKSGPMVSLIPGSDSISIGDLADGETASFSLELALVCATESNAVEYTVNVEYDELCESEPNTATHVSTEISVLSAVLSVISSNIMGNYGNGNVYDAVVGVPDTIKVPVVNAGAGGIDSFVYWTINPASVENLDVLLAGESLEFLGQTGDTLFYAVATDDIIRDQTMGGGSGNGDALFSENESLLFCEVWQGVECDFGVPDPIKRAARYSCGSFYICSESNVSTTGIDFGFAIPDIVYATYEPLINRPECYSEDNTSLALEIINQGLAPASNLLLEMRQGGLPGAIVESSIMYSNNPAGPYSSAVTISNTEGANGTAGTSGQCVSGAGLLRSADVSLDGVVIEPGDTIYFIFELEHGCDCRPCNIQGIHGANIPVVRWQDPCEIDLAGGGGGSFPGYNATLDGFFDGESSASGSGCVTYQITSGTSSWFGPDFPDAYFESRLTVQCGINITTISAFNSDGSPGPPVTIVSNNNGGAVADDEVIFTIDQNISGTLEICYDVACSEKPPGCPLTADMTMTNYFFPSPSCAVSCEANVSCEKIFPFVFTCGPCVPCDGLTTTFLDVNRTNYCFLDANNDYIPDDGSLADKTTAKGKRFVQGDSLELEIQAVVETVTGTETWEFAFLELDLQTSEFSIVGAEFSVYDASNDTTLVCNSLEQSALDTILLTDLSIASMTSLGCSDFIGFEYADGDTLNLKVFYAIKEAFTGQSKQIILEPNFYLSDDIYGAGSTEVCGFLKENINQIGTNSGFSVNIAGVEFGGCDIAPFSMTSFLYYGEDTFDEFCNEIRSPGIPEKLTFVKPPELEFTTEDFTFSMSHALDGTPTVVSTSDIPGIYFLESGDTLCFFVKDYLSSLPDPVILDKGIDEGYFVSFGPAVRGNCSTEITGYDACASFIADVDDQVFCQDKINYNEQCGEFFYTGGPTLAASTPLSVVEVFGQSSCVTLQITNLSTINAPFSWLDIEAVTGGMTVTSLIETTGGMNNLIPPTMFGTYELGFTNAGAEREFLLCVNLTDCAPQTLNFTAGWDCVDYPETVEEATCNSPSTIQFTTVESDYAGQLIKPVVNTEYALCDTICFVHRFSSTKFGNIHDIIFDFKLPGGTEYVPGSFEIAYPVPKPSTTDTMWVFVEDPINTVDNRWVINVSSLNETLDSTGLIGVLGALDNLNIVLVRWNAVTTCDYISGSRASFRTNASNTCGDPLPTLRSKGPRMLIQNILPEYEIDLTLNDLTLNPCNADEATVSIEMEIDAAGAITTMDTDTIKISLPEGISYVDMTYNDIQNATASPPMSVDDNGLECLYLPIEPGLVNGDVIAFELNILASDVGQQCGNFEMLVQTFSATNAFCGAAECSISALSGEDAININVSKPDLSIVTADLTLVSVPPSSATLDYEVKVMNNGDVPLESGNTFTIEFWNDVDDNGLLDTLVDNLIVSADNNVDISTGSMAIVSGSVPTPPTGLCNALVVLNPNSTCVCNINVSNQTQISIENEFDMEVSVCSNDVISIGPDSIMGFDYKWLGLNGASLDALSSTTSTPTDLQFSNTTGADIVWNYALRSSFGECYTYDTMEVTIFSEMMGMATVPGCEGADLILPGPVEGSDFLWSPTMDLDDATSNFPVLSPVATGTTIYTVSYTDINGCGASKSVTVVGAGCAPGTALGDTVWFDINENGMQDFDEPGIPDVVVYLYNANNTTPGNDIASTTTDANGYYIFDNLVAGNYVVQFVSPDGFIFTSTNFVANDSLDSDADMGTGYTGSYYLPNGVFNPTIDAGFIPDCSLDVMIADVSDCIYDGVGHTREITVDISWSNAVYTYDFLGGVDTIQLEILGQSFEYIIDTLSGDTTQLVILDTMDMVDIIADATLSIDNDCLSSDTVAMVAPCIYDLALIKQIDGFGPFSYGDTLTFNFTIENQGAQAANNIKFNDFLPSGYEFIPALNPDWTASSSDTLMYTITDPLAPGETTVISLDLELIMSTEVDAYLNTSEIFSFTDTLGVDRSDQDIDSTPDGDHTNDSGGVVNSGSDNALNGNGTGATDSTNPNDDEDDEDPELVTIVDLALVKDILTPGPYDYGDTIEFQITVTNQGNVTAQNIKVNDFIPNGFAWDISNEPNWILMGSTAMDTIPGPISTGESVTTTIKLVVQMADPDQYINIAEIGYFEDTTGSDITNDDIDSQADNDPDNDAGGNPGTNTDGSENGDGTGNPQDTDPATDEDDNDPAYISIPQIDLTKTTTSVVPAQSGTEGNYDATYEFVITNPGNEKLTCIQLQDDLVEQLGGTFVGITSAPMVTPLTDADIVPTLTMGYNGGVIDTIFNGTTGCLNPGQTITVQMTIEINSTTGPDPIINNGDVSAKSPTSVVVMESDTAVVEVPGCFLQTICPVDQVTLECINDIPASGTTVAWFNGIDGISAIVSSCDIPTITVNDTDNGGAGCTGDPYILTREIIVLDTGNGLSVPEADTCEIIYTIVDDIKPLVMNSPQDIILECGADNTIAINNWLSTNGGGMFIDGCGSVMVTATPGTTVAMCGSTSTTPYTFTATDQCGNSVSEVANLILIDTTVPTLILPSGASTISCDASPDPDGWAATAMASDGCDTSPTVDFALIGVEEVCNGNEQQTIYTYNFVAEDACGNMSAAQMGTYTIVDSDVPTITAPADLSVSCGQDISLLVAGWLDNVMVSDNCDNSTELMITSDFDASSIMNACGATIPVVWTVVDGCGGMNMATADIVIATDSQGPVMTCSDTLIFNIDVGSCGAIVNLPLPLATDCNGVDSIKQISPLINSEFPIGFTTVEFQSWDGCGNSTTCETVVEIVDTNSPDLICPPSVNQCADADVCTWTSDATVNPIASDCGGTTLTYSVLNPDASTSTPGMIEGYAFMVGSSTVTVTATDNADPMNTSECSFTVTVTDCQDPVIDTCPAVQNMVECGSEDIATWAATLSGSDNCDTDLSEDYYILSQINNCGGTSTSTYVFVVTDDAGNSTSCTSTYTTVDSTMPTIDTPANNPMVNCTENNTTNFIAWLNSNGGAIASDVCSGPVNWSNNWDGSLPSGCIGDTDLTITFTATDDCGNTISTDGTYTITDIIAPTLSLPDNLVLECGNTNNLAITQNWLSSAFGTDACSEVVVTNDFDTLQTSCNVPLTVTFTAMDECGNMASDTRTITLTDITNPVIINNPTDLVLECGFDNTAAINDWEATNGGGSATDMCGSLTTTFVANGATGLCGGTTSTQYIFTATDDCGNSTSTTANLILIDTTDPVLTLPPGDNEFSCDENPDPVAWAQTATVFDLCDSEASLDIALVNLTDTCNGIIQVTEYTYLFVAEDGCGNKSASQTATYTVVDSIVPTLTAPADLMVSCGQDISLLVVEWLDDVVAADNCDDMTEALITNDYDASATNNECGATIPVTWTVKDGCGGTSTATANIVIAEDTEGPLMACSDTLTFAVDVNDCGANIALSLPEATDCNGVDSIKQVSPLPNMEFPIGFTTVTFQSWDACGNTSTCETVVEIIDTQNPELTCPPSINRCADPDVCTWTSDATVNPVTSDCSGTTLTYSVTNPDSSISTPAIIEGYVFALGSSVVTITATDNADPSNSTTCNFTVTVTDCQDPVIDVCPTAQTMVECGSEDIVTWAATLSGSDNCDMDLTESYYILTQTNECGGTSTSTYVFIVTDDAGNSASCTSTYTIVDTNMPTIDMPASNPMVNCSEDNNTNFLAWLNSNGGAVASDGCSGPVSWTNNWDGTLPTGCTGFAGITITFTATDDCGNSETTDGTYTITDGMNPILTLPNDLILECGNPNDTAIVNNWLSNAIATDDCDDVTLTNDFSMLPMTCNMPVTVTFIATDACDNVTSDTRTITLIDIESPTILVYPQDTILECGSSTLTADIQAWVDNSGGAVSEDNCASSLSESFVAGTPVPQCGGTSTTPYTYTVMDECGNETVETVYLILIDVTPPAAMCVAPFDLQLDENGQAFITGADINDGSTDLCTDDAELTYAVSPSSFTELDLGPNEVTLTVTDACGNSSTCTTTVTILGTGSIGAAKRVVSVNLGEDGCTDVVYEINIENFGNVNIDSVQVLDDLEAAGFGACGSFTTTLTSDDFIVNPNYNGTTDSLLLVGLDDLPVGDVGAILLTVNACGCPDGTVIMNSATATGVTPAGDPLTDDSVDGSDPDPNNDNNPDESSTTDTTLTIDPVIGLAKRLVNVSENADGSADVTFEFNIENLGNVTIDSIQVMDDLGVAFDPCTSIEVLSLTSDDYIINTTYNGTTDLNLLEGYDSVEPSDVGAILLTIKVDSCGMATGPFTNYGFITGLSPDGTMVMDTSQNGAVSDANGDGDPTNDNEGTDVEFMYNGSLGVAKRLSYGPILSTNNCYDITFEINVQNYGNVDIDSIQVTEDLLAVFSPNDIWTILSIESEEFEVNTGFDGSSDINLLTGNDVLISAPNGDNGAIYISLNVCPSGDIDEYFNSVFGSGVIPDGSMVQDTSQNGSVPDENGDGDPTNDNDPTPFQLECEIPMFTNCPRPNVVVDAPEGWCSSFVNFSAPLATAECGLDTILQVDNTGLNSGDLFPVGTTILQWVAYDIFGNASDTCEIKIIVNDFHTPPTITCPEDVEAVNDPGQCGAIVTENLAPIVEDNCPDNLVVLYEVVDEFGVTLFEGIEDATGEEFPGGTTTLTYTVYDQPLLLITEILQDGASTGIEIGNIGPAAVDISCADVSRTDEFGNVITYNIPNGTVVNVGDVWTYLFNGNFGGDERATFTFSFTDLEIDAITINDGTLIGTNIIRIDPVDNDNASDWMVVNDCISGSFGVYNPELPVYTDNGTTTSLQSKAPSSASCSTTVTVLDIEAPSCASQDTISYTDTSFGIMGGMCTTSELIVGPGFIDDINISNLTATIDNAGAVTASLTSPSGTEITLFSGLCNGTPDIMVSLDDSAPTHIQNAGCSPLGNGSTFKPQNAFKAFAGESSEGIWTLSMYVLGDATGMIDTWTLEVLTNVPYNQMDTLLMNDPSVCDAEFTWTHPIFQDNCCEGSIDVTYSFVNDTTGINSIHTEAVLTPNGFVDFEGQMVTRDFEVGVTEVTYTLTDLSGNQSFCGFKVTVVDGEAPEFGDGCEDVDIYLEPGQCNGAISQLPNVSDNCGLADVSYYSEGALIDVSNLPIGMNEITVVSTDIYGNMDTCTFIANIIEFDGDSGNLACNNNINLSLGVNCTAEVTADMILEGGPYGCYDDYCVTITTSTGIEVDNIFDLSDVGQTFTVTITDCQGNGNSCWGYVNIEEKLIPEIECPADIEITCNQDPEDVYPIGHPLEGLLVTGEATLLTCENNATITYLDDVVDYGVCSDPRVQILRRWKVVDNVGNSNTCDQLITVLPYDPANVEFPDDFTFNDAFSCSAIEANPDTTLPEFTGYPMLNGMSIFGPSYCDINVGYWDEILQDVNCPVAYSILRHWIIENECLPIEEGVNPLKHIQRIKVDDNSAPTLLALEDVTISVDPWSCTGTYGLPEVVHDDDCSDYNVKWNVSYGQVEDGIIYNLLVGETSVTARVTDGCGNFAYGSFTITTLDSTPPVVTALQNIVISLSTNEGSGTAKLFAESVDNGSFDGCSDVHFEVRREDDPCDILGNTTYNDDGHSFDGSSNPNSPSYDPDMGAFVTFCCDDIYNSVVDINDDGVLDPGYVKVWLRVWDDGDKDGIFGTDGDNFNEAWAYVKVEDKLAPQITCPEDVTILCSDDYEDVGVTGTATGFGSCGEAEVVYDDIIVNLSDCGDGFVRRRWSIVGRSDMFCDQTITVEPIESTPVTVSFAQVGDFEAEGCPDEIAVGEPTWIAGPCEIIGYTVETDTFLFEDGACYKLVNNWTVVNWCTYDPNNPDSEGIWEHVQVIKVTDNTQPTIEDCDDKMFEVNDHSDADGDGTICEAQVTLVNSAFDPGSENCPTGWLKWQIEVDLWSDGTIDLEFSSFLPPFDNNYNDTNGNGVPDKYVAPTANGDEVSVNLPDIEGSMSNHKVKWTVTDGCQNNMSCSTNFMVVDKKAPTPYCVDISSAVMESDGTLELWAIDFNIGSFDNCTASENLRYTFTEVAPEDDPNYDEDLKSSSMIFDCEDVESSPVEINMYVWDEKGNADYCVVYLTLVDNGGACNDGAMVSGLIATEVGDGVEGVLATLNATLPEYPRTDMSEEDGSYLFLGVPYNANYKITAFKDDDYRNGVSTLDLVLIQRHILELQLFDSPYKVIASDITGDEKVKASDLTLLRKLILGIIDDLPNNDSWRFVNSTQTFADIMNPWPINEDISISDLTADSEDNDFVAIKIGDVSGNAATNLTEEAMSFTRENPLLIYFEDKLIEKGDRIEVAFSSENIEALYGYQFTLETNGMEYENVEGRLAMMEDANIGSLGNGVLTVSYGSIEPMVLKGMNELFVLEFQATEDGQLSEMISLTGSVTGKEAYVGKALSVRDVELANRTTSEDEFEYSLMQNEPNPFKTSTKIGFELREAGDVKLSISDLTGKVVKVITTNGVAGYNELILNADELGISGVLYYQIESGEFTASKKMILIK